ncbi:MAG: DUF4326 domain-containing protein [Halobaculum sp.]
MGYQSTLTGGPRTTLVNVSRHGRDGVVMIDRTTQFGNPFKLEEDGGEYNRDASVEKYREWFVRKMQTDPAFREAVNGLEGETLGCWCKPKRCHGDVLLAYLRGELEIPSSDGITGQTPEPE